MYKICSLLKDPRRVITGVLCRLLIWLPDTLYLKMRYRLIMGRPLRLDNPQTFNEKINWLKINYQNKILPTLVDKSTVKEYVSGVIGPEYIIPTYGVWDRFEDIDFDSMPNQFVLKSTNGGGGTGVVVCKDKRSFDYKDAKNTLHKSMKDNGRISREWPYKHIHPRIIAEKYMADPSVGELRDYKFFCFNGKVRCFKVDYGRFVDHHANYYDASGNYLDFGEVDYCRNRNADVHIPSNISEMLQIAEMLSYDIPFVRVDLYNISGHIYFGEMTFYPAGGYGKIDPPEWDSKLGSWLQLP